MTRGRRKDQQWRRISGGASFTTWPFMVRARKKDGEGARNNGRAREG